VSPKTLVFQFGLLLAALGACGQGTFIYDQQSATNRSGNYGAAIQQVQPMGQSFIPALSSVGFVQFQFADTLPQDGIGATVCVNLWSDAIGTGTLLGSTTPVYMPDGFYHAVTNFYFSAPISATPGTTYYLQPVQQSGDANWAIVGDYFNYPGGTMYALGAPNPNGLDLWFREGILVPEPSSWVLALLGMAVWVCIRTRRRLKPIERG
jgi:hypothetical protein